MAHPTGAGGTGHRRFDVLVVCTANLCRSPLIEALLAERLAHLPGSWTVRSAGVDARPDRPMHALSAQALAESGIATDPAWRSQQLTADLVQGADLVLTATRAHRADVVALVPGATGRVFTVRQFVRLLSTPDLGDLHLDDAAHPGEVLVARAHAARGAGSPGRPGDDDIPDPIGRPYRTFHALAGELAGDVDAITAPVASFR